MIHGQLLDYVLRERELHCFFGDGRLIHVSNIPESEECRFRNLLSDHVPTHDEVLELFWPSTETDSKTGTTSR